MIEVFDKEDAKHYLDKDDFGLSWINLLDSDETITDFDVTVVSGNVVVESSSIDNKKTIARLSGGDLGLAHLRYSITTSKGRILNAEVYVKVIYGNL